MDYFKKILKESVIIVIISSVIGIVSGTFLSLNEEILYSFPIILLLLPSLNALIGSISTILTSRLTSHLYIGTLPPKIQKSERLKEDFLGLFITIILCILALIILGYSIGFMTGIQMVNPFLIIIIIMVTILLLFGVMFIFLYVFSVFFFKRGRDPNNFLIPFTTSLLDFLTPLVLIMFLLTFT